MEIKPARTPEEIDGVKALFREYEAFLDVDLCFQSFEEELAGLPGKYTPPQGALLMGLEGERLLGCVALRKLDKGICEMKRLYVRPQGQGRGLGRMLAQKIIETARDLGYGTMRLDTLEKLKPALGLYAALGFSRTAPYYRNPLPGVVYLELNLWPMTEPRD